MSKNHIVVAQMSVVYTFKTNKKHFRTNVHKSPKQFSQEKAIWLFLVVVHLAYLKFVDLQEFIRKTNFAKLLLLA